MLLTFKDLDAGLYLAVFIIIFTSSLLLCKTIIWNFLDPLVMLLLNIAFNFSIIIYSYIKNQLDVGYLIYCSLSFIIFIFSLKASTSYFYKGVDTPKKLVFKGPNRFFTIALIYFSLFLITINNLFLISKVGLGIIDGSVNPDLVKVTVSQGGAGVFQKVAIASQLLLVPLLTHAYFTFKIKILVFLSLGYFVFSSLFFNFSKAGLISFILNLGIVLYYYKAYLNFKIFSLKKIAIFALVGLGSAMIVLVNISLKYGYSITDLLLDRFIATGGGTYQYFILNGHYALDKYTFLQKLANYFDVILSTFKLKDWEPLGYIAKMTEYLTGLSLAGFGTNPYLFVDGFFLFGWFGTLYCGFLGILIGYCRTLNVGILSFYLLNFIIPIFAADPGTAQHFIVAVLFFLPIYFAVKIISEIAGKHTTILKRRFT